MSDANKKLGLFDDPNGDFSSGRLNASIVIWTGILITIIGASLGIYLTLLEKPGNIPSILLTAGPLLIGSGLGFQGWHKQSESTFNSISNQIKINPNSGV